jgi:hypothetical protein
MEVSQGAVPFKQPSPPLLSWPHIVVLLSLLMLGHGNTLLSDPDTYWHIAAGRWIVANGRVPHTDPFSHSMAGAPWTAHEWLSEVVMALVFQAGGWPALAVLTVICWALALAILTRFLLSRLEPVHALLFTALAVAMTATHLLVRPHSLVMPILVLWTATIVDQSERHTGPPWWLIGIMVLWANLHGSFTLGLALAAAIGFEATVTADKGRRIAAAKQWGLFIALCVAAAMLNPAGWRALWFTVEVMRMDVALSIITEWQSPQIRLGHPLELWFLVVLVAAFTGRLRLPWVRLVLLLALIHLALKHGRNIATLGWVSPILIATALARGWYASRRPAADVDRLDQWFRALAGPSRLAGSLMVAGVSAAVLVIAAQRATIQPVAGHTPDAALEAARRAGVINTPVFNAYVFGGYLIYRGIPVYIDGRADMYGDEFMRRLRDVWTPKTSDVLLHHLDEYRIGWTLLDTGSHDAVLLDVLPGWRRIHADNVAVVHVRSPAVKTGSR